MLSLITLEMDGVMMKITTMTAILMAVTVVDQMLTPNIVHSVFVMNKRLILNHSYVPKLFT